MDLSALTRGWRPPSRSMIDRRRWPKIALASCSVPSPSGPRCRRAVSMLRMPSNNTDSLPTIPAIPHILWMLQWGRPGYGSSHSAREQLLVSRGAALDEEVLNLGEIVPSDGGAALRPIAQGAHRGVEALQIVQPDHIPGVRR